MVIGLFQRHYKIYKGSIYIPFGKNELESFNLFIGQNGAGKSSILEALDTFFNGREFVVHQNEKKEECFVAPLFLIEKAKIDLFSKQSKDILPIVSSFLFEFYSDHANYIGYKSFFEQRDNIKHLEESSFLLTSGSSYTGGSNDNFLYTFSSQIVKRIKATLGEEYPFQKALNDLKNDLLNIYTYLYIPVETSIEEFLRLEALGMQKLMSQNVKKQVENTLNQKIQAKTIEGSRQRKLSPLDIINEDLESFISKVEATIQSIDPAYNFQLDSRAKRKLTANHLTDVIVESFFSKRKLRKGEKLISNLSAGERKKALIDIAYSFLTQNEDRVDNIILAIDEPEASLHISMCYDQFERLEDLGKLYSHQLFITTHWYGSLPIIEKGNLYSITSFDEQVEIKEFSFKNYFEERKHHPEDIQFKSFFDLSSAIISSMRIKENNWIIVESEEDKNYIMHYLGTTLDYKILPVGGCSIVKILYEYLYLPISQKSESESFKGKIICLIDTDKQGIQIEIPEESKNKLIKIRRLQIDDSGIIKLFRMNNPLRFPTEIEEALNPKKFFIALQQTIEQKAGQDIRETFNVFNFDENSTNSFIKGDNSIIYQIDNNGKTPRENKELINQFVDQHKKDICMHYCMQQIENKPVWITEIESFLN